MTVVTLQPQFTFGANCYLVASAKGNCAIIDPGAEGEQIHQTIQERGWTPRMILLTHGHFDHVGAVEFLRKIYPEVTVYLNEKDLPMVTGAPEAMTPTLRTMIQTMQRRPEEFLISVDAFLEEGTVLVLDELTFAVMETPGHSKGSVCIACGDALFTGDTLFHHDVGRTDLFGGSSRELYHSIQRLQGLTTNYIIYPGHEEASTMAEEAEFFRAFLECQS